MQVKAKQREMAKQSLLTLSELTSATVTKSTLGDTSDPVFFTAELENLK